MDTHAPRRDSWTGPELLDALDEFEAVLRAANLRENTVQTYVERSRIFVRWLMDDYTPRGPL